ncbi:HdeD family acid-resistance protein [Sinosporangium siamense]|uniref:Membrane protein n=1 Tax=Sinosporangium siamense TaxID=1367973 RepID=A0A919VC89_9ACTN|nr:HdeD family acid-resistance protein [Sinosporangium siamense]GII92899.1 membrane protein [Sinosporangium siamense]
MRRHFASSWWAILVRGIAAIVFGVLALIWPAITILTLVFLFGVFVLVNGVFAILGAIRGVSGDSRAWLALSGVVGVLVGIAVLVWPGITTVVLLFLIALWAIVTGVLEIISAIRLREAIQQVPLLILAGIVSIVFGILMFVWPATGALALVWLIGIFAIVWGVILVVLSSRVKKLRTPPAAPPRGSPDPYEGPM